jgi:hypothetical protein
MENTVFFCQERVFTGTLPSNGCLSIAERVCYRNVFTNPSPSNGCTCHVAPSLRLFIPNNLQTYRHSFSSKGCACKFCDRSHLPFRVSAFRSVYSPIAPVAPSLRPLDPCGSLIRCQSVQVYDHHPVFFIFFEWWGKTT